MNTTASEVRSLRWNVTVPKSVPSYALEKRGTEQINKSANFVSQKIDEYLRMSSIHAKFDSQNAEATCVTTDYLHFNIYLYAGPVTGSTYVEVIRVKGCGFSFRKEYEKIMNAAKGQGITTQQPKQHSTTLNGGRVLGMMIPPSFLKSYTPPSESDVENMLDRSSRKLVDASKSYETTAFILQNLVSLTTPDMHYSQNNAHHRMSLLIMQNRNNIRDTILSIYKAYQDYSMDDDEVSEKIRNAAMTIFTNGILAVCKENEKHMCLDQEYEAFIEELVPSLVEEVANYEKCINNACLAMKCLGTMVVHSQLTHDRLRKTQRLETLVEEAKSYGWREHLRLEKSAIALFEALYRNGVIENNDIDSQRTSMTELTSFSSISSRSIVPENCVIENNDITDSQGNDMTHPINVVFEEEY